MTSHVIACPIWGDSHRAEVVHVDQTRMLLVGDSPRTGGKYAVSEALVNAEIKHMTDHEKARLTTWLVDQRTQGVDQPEITETVVKHVKLKGPLPVHERTDRLLRYLVQKSGIVGQEVEIGCEGERNSYGEWVEHRSPSAWEAMAWSESTQREEVRFLINYLQEQNYITAASLSVRCWQLTVTIEGYARISDVSISQDSSQVFVAMWFDDSMALAYRDGIEPGIRDAGYNPLRIDRKEHINKIDDEIIAELRRSRFIVADFTHGIDGARGGVYYEAGFGHGLGLPVIFTCRENALDTLHFDTEHYSHIVWTDPDDLREKLKNRILAVID